MKWILALSVVFGTSAAFADTMTGQLFKKDSQRKELLFTFKNNSTETAGTIKTEGQFSDPSNQVVVSEVSERQGSILKSYSVDHIQTGRKGSIVVEGKKVIFNYEENGKKKGPETEDLKDNFVVGHTLVAYVANHWKEIMDGKTIDVRFGVWDRQETVGFSLFKVGEEKLDGKDTILLKFKPTSFVIAAIVDPVIFKFRPDGKELMGMVGRVMPKRKDGNKWKDLDAEVIYKSGN